MFIEFESSSTSMTANVSEISRIVQTGKIIAVYYKNGTHDRLEYADSSHAHRSYEAAVINLHNIAEAHSE